MVVRNTDIMSAGEVESPMQPNQQLGRQSSIYSLTLDEFQHTLNNESGKNFGSMNMDEFLNSIWTAEENQGGGGGNGVSGNGHIGSGEPNMIARQQSLSRQGSLSLPGPLSRKTVDEVWSEIQKTQHQVRHRPSTKNDQVTGSGSGSAQRQPTYGEMTLEDFLVKAGVVKDQNCSNAPPVQQQHAPAPFGLFPNGNNRVVGPGPRLSLGSAHITPPVMGGGPYSPIPHVPGGKRVGPYQQQPPPCYGGIVGNGGGVAGGYGPGLGIGSPTSPVSSDGIGASPVQNGMDIGGERGGLGRIIDGPVEKAVERRQRRMIKNRESAARSRARKQAYTVELEAELNMLKEENAQLKQALAEVERKRKQQLFEEMRMNSVPKSQKVKGKSRVLRRTASCST